MGDLVQSVRLLGGVLALRILFLPGFWGFSSFYTFVMMMMTMLMIMTAIMVTITTATILIAMLIQLELVGQPQRDSLPPLTLAAGRLIRPLTGPRVGSSLSILIRRGRIDVPRLGSWGLYPANELKGMADARLFRSG